MYVVWSHIEGQSEDSHRAMGRLPLVPPLETGSPNEEISTAGFDAQLGFGVPIHLKHDGHRDVVLLHVDGRGEPRWLGDRGKGRANGIVEGSTQSRQQTFTRVRHVKPPFSATRKKSRFLPINTLETVVKGSTARYG